MSSAGAWVAVPMSDGSIRQDWIPDEQPASPTGTPGRWHVVMDPGGQSSHWVWFEDPEPAPVPPPALLPSPAPSPYGAAPVDPYAAAPVDPYAAAPARYNAAPADPYAGTGYGAALAAPGYATGYGTPGQTTAPMTPPAAGYGAPAAYSPASNGAPSASYLPPASYRPGSNHAAAPGYPGAGGLTMPQPPVAPEKQSKLPKAKKPAGAAKGKKPAPRPGDPPETRWGMLAGLGGAAAAIAVVFLVFVR